MSFTAARHQGAPSAGAAMASSRTVVDTWRHFHTHTCHIFSLFEFKRRAEAVSTCLLQTLLMTIDAAGNRTYMSLWKVMEGDGVSG